ncbi:MAG: NAD(P)-dependent glycerol-3-phosphate dehydrogenase [Elusimicrobia bacterium]|nr:NAD(P)-dependent glycerol-3-phosphate dehydrogenase [Elusimicrobiota bacterium]
MADNLKITVLGGGLWGTVLADHLSRGGFGEVRLWEFVPKLAEGLARSRSHPHIPGFDLHTGVEVTSDLAMAAEQAGLVLFVLPSAFVRQTARKLRSFLGKARPLLINASKGIEPGSLRTMGDAILSELPRGVCLCTLSGPSFAREVAKQIPTCLVLAGPAAAGRKLLPLFNAGALRARWSPDRRGVELGGSLKNALAIGCGILDGLKAGANTKAALLIQGIAEMGELIERSGGRRETIYGLAGLGDLIATGTSPESRNRAFGEKLGEGKTREQALKEIPTVVEGVEASASARALCRRLKLKAPVLEAIWQAVHGGRDSEIVISALGFSRGTIDGP